ncbi:hypothetical protein IAD21_00711 [Abditibacteriota bacterium]|nr:hypothetical protein IAD21_00711 [Abditibacteriota bacterium]
MHSSETKDLTPKEIEQWTIRLTYVWETARIDSIRSKADGGVLVITELAGGLRLHLGIDREGINLCGVWRGEECVLWDRRIGLCAVSGPIPAPPDEHPSAFHTAMRPVLRRNCFLLGVNIEATEQEKCDWEDWLILK